MYPIVFLNPILNKECIVSKVIDEFGLKAAELTGVRIKSDGSNIIILPVQVFNGGLLHD